MRLCGLLLFLCIYYSSSSQIFILNEGAGNDASLLTPVFELRASFNDGKLWPRIKLAEGYSLSEQEFEALRVKYVKYFTEDRLRKSLMLTLDPQDKNFVKWTIGILNPDKTITIYGQLIVSYNGIDPVLGYPLISNIQLKSPPEVKPLDVNVIEKMYAEETERRKKFPKPPPLPR